MRNFKKANGEILLTLLLLYKLYSDLETTYKSINRGLIK